MAEVMPTLSETATRRGTPKGRALRGIGSITSSREVTAQELTAARRGTGPLNDGVALGVVPRVKANTDTGKASHSGRHDAPIAWSLDTPKAEDGLRPELDADARPRANRRIAHVSARLSASRHAANPRGMSPASTDEPKRFPIEHAVVWFLAGVAVALAILVATT